MKLILNKRVVGLPGDIVKYEDNVLYINDKKVEENYSREYTEDFITKVGKDKYFVLGDNRGNSTDSRIIGAVDRKKILGKTNLVVYPFNRFGVQK